MEGRVVKLQFEEGIAQRFKVGGIDRINPGIDDGSDDAETGKGFGSWIFCEVIVSPILTSAVILMLAMR